MHEPIIQKAKDLSFKAPPIPTDYEGLQPVGQRPLIMVPFRGGAVTVREPALLPSGAFSMIQNMRGLHPGFEQRKGQRKHHSTADGTNRVETLYEFSKGKRVEKHLFAQMSDGDVLEATDLPPAVTTGVFGSEVFSGGASQKPASWANVKDLLIHSNGVDQHQVYAGDENPVEKFIVYQGAADPGSVPEIGVEYTKEVTDGLGTTCAILDSLDTYANHDCVFIFVPVRANKLTWTVSKPNGNAATSQLYYRKSDNTWASCSITDGTASGGATLGQSGAMTWTLPSDEIPWYQYGLSGFWYQLRVSAALDSEVEVTALTYGSGFQDIVNVWDGAPVYAVEARVYDQSAGTHKLYSTDTIVISALEASSDDTKDRVYWNSKDPLMGIYVDVGDKPNANGTLTIGGVKTWTGAAWESVGTVSDGTSGLTRSGWITWPRKVNEPTQFQGSEYYAYWYYLWVSTANVSADVTISIECMPYFDIEEVGRGIANAAWKGRACYSFDRHGQYIYVAAKDAPLCLNGADYGILWAGDGRTNRVVWMGKFANELLAYQEEKGKEGGCITLFEGYSPTTFGRLCISTIAGAMNAKAVVVVEGILTSTATEEKLKTLAFSLSRFGVCATDGQIVTVISDDIQNYFDPNEAECIRYGYEDKMWIEHDKSRNVLLVGLVSGASATECNVFPVFDLVDKTWSFDKRTQPLACMAEIEAGSSGNVPVLQIAGGTDDGTVYQLNYGTNDVDQAIDAYVTVELDMDGLILFLRELLLRMKVQAAGNCTITPYINGVAGTAITMSMTAEKASETIRRHREGWNLVGGHLALKFQNAVASQEIYLINCGLNLLAEENW